MSGLDLNLARTPFANRRPVLRMAVVLWGLAIALLAVNASLYWGHFSGRGEQQEELTQLRSRIAEESAERDEALARLDVYDIEWQRDQIEFLNARIAERTFAWSALFDHLAEVLPATIRFSRLSPKVTSSAGSRSRRAGAARTVEDEVGLELTGVAEDDEVLLEMVDAFYRHPRFRRPDLQIESRSDSGDYVDFSMNVVYMPEATKPPAKQPREANREPADAEDDAPSEPEVES